MSFTQRFPRNARLTRRAEYTRAFAEGRRVRTRHFALIAVPGAPVARLGLAIGRRSAARAVTRNRMKRLIREVFRQTELPPLDIVVTVRAGAEHVSNRELRAELARGFERLRQA